MNPASLPILATVLVAGAVAVGAAPARSPQNPEMVEMEVAGVFPLEGGQAGMLVLREKGRDVLLPIVVGRGEADAVEMRLGHREPARPRAQELLRSAIAALGGKVMRVEISDSSEALYRARVHLARGAERVELEARPSDSIALALGAAAPIYAPRKLLRESGLTSDDIRRMDRKDAPPPSAAPGAGMTGVEQRM